MLLEFRLSNFRSFFGEAVFSMIASTKQRKFNDRLIPLGDSAVLPSVVIYGANASGKTALIMALDFLKAAVLKGTIKDTPGDSLIAVAELFPFIHDYDRFKEPVWLELTFCHRGLELRYGLRFRAELKEDNDLSERMVVSEELYVDGEMVFDRSVERGVRISTSGTALRYYKEAPGLKFLKKLERQINENLAKEELFITNAFKLVNHNLAQAVSDWFEHKLHPLWNFDERRISPLLPDKMPQGRVFLRNKVMDALLRHADFGPQEVAYVVDSQEHGSSKTSLRSRYQVQGAPDHYDLDVPAELTESKGTLRILQFALPFISALQEGLTLFVDELDSSIHPDIIAGILRVFNNRELNTKGAQLVMTTHNPVYLDNNLLRRDQVVFVSRDRETYQSELYSLADFKTSGKAGVRADERYMRNYLSGKYGALPLVDFEGAIGAALEAAEKGE